MFSNRIEFQRRFHIELYVASHRQLLLRSRRSDTDATRVEVLFKDVTMLKMPTSFTGLVITEASKDEAAELDPLLDSKVTKYRKVFIIRGDGFSGYVVAAAVFWHEDEGSHLDKNYFSSSFEGAPGLSAL
jgi:hypothetical protein